MSDPSEKPSIFVSHTHADRGIAGALRDSVRELFGERVVVHYSTNKEAEGGIGAGQDWFKWIADRVQESRVALILLTPSSIQKPWILWEAGAVTGSALSRDQAQLRKVRPILYQLSPGDAPTPFHNVQTLRGDSATDVRRLFGDFLEEFGDLLSVQHVIQAGEKLERVISTYLGEVNDSLLNAPLMLTEAAVQEWSERLDELRAQRRESEVDTLHDWIDAAFGRGRQERPRPLDLRLHRRLGQLYLAAQKYKRAVEQFELARQLAPRDIFILRLLGQAYLGDDDHENAGAIIGRITELDAEAFVRNAECAALKGRWHRQRNDDRSAHDTYEAAFRTNPGSYYLGDLLGQAKLELNDVEGARQTYGQVLHSIEELDELNLWVYATAATAAIVMGRDEKAIEYLAAIGPLHPSRENLRSITEGLKRLQVNLGVDEASCESWLAALAHTA